MIQIQDVTESQLKGALGSNTLGFIDNLGLSYTKNFVNDVDKISAKVTSTVAAGVSDISTLLLAGPLALTAVMDIVTFTIEDALSKITAIIGQAIGEMLDISPVFKIPERTMYYLKFYQIPIMADCLKNLLLLDTTKKKINEIKRETERVTKFKEKIMSYVTKIKDFINKCIAKFKKIVNDIKTNIDKGMKWIAYQVNMAELQIIGQIWKFLYGVDPTVKQRLALKDDRLGWNSSKKSEMQAKIAELQAKILEIPADADDVDKLKIQEKNKNLQNKIDNLLNRIAKVNMNDEKINEDKLKLEAEANPREANVELLESISNEIAALKKKLNSCSSVQEVSETITDLIELLFKFERTESGIVGYIVGLKNCVVNNIAAILALGIARAEEWLVKWAALKLQQLIEEQTARIKQIVVMQVANALLKLMALLGG